MSGNEQALEKADTDDSEGPREDWPLVEALRRGDEAAFVSLVGTYHESLVRLATVFVDSRAVAEEVAQETWLAVLHGLDSFEGRSSLKTWIFRILTNRAKTRGQREGRFVPFSSFESSMSDPDEPAVESERFNPPGHRWAGHWASFPDRWGDNPETALLADEVRERAEEAIDGLPPSQRTVITLRDVEGWTSEEVCNILEVTETNQRVLLHRARSRVRRSLEAYFASQ